MSFDAASAFLVRRIRLFAGADHVRNGFPVSSPDREHVYHEHGLSVKPSLKIAAWLAGAALLVVVGVTASLWTFRQVEQAAAIRAHTHSLIDAASGLMSSLTDMETGQRGYLLTGDEAYLQPYLAEREKVTQSFDGLRATTLLAAAQRRLGALAPLLAAQLVDLDQSIELRRGQGFGEALTRLRHG